MKAILSYVKDAANNDLVQVNTPNAITIGALTFADVQAWATFCLTVTSIICTILLTIHKTRKNDSSKD